MKILTPRIARLVSTITLFALPVGIALIPLVGCGGGNDSPSVSATSRTARATVAIQWPERDTRLVPIASNSVRITITNASGFRTTQVIARPATNAIFENLPPGALTVTATAHSDSTAEALPAQAQGTQVVTAVADETFALTLTMASTIDHLALTASGTTIAVGQTATIAAGAQDASNNLVLTGATTWQWTSSNTAVATVSSTGTGTATIDALTAGTVVIQATETESGKTANLSFTVSLAPTPSPSPSPTPSVDPFAGVHEYTTIDVNNLPNYANPAYPVHYDAAVLGQDNAPGNNPVTNKGATLGRVLFFDKRLSINDTVACASCHQQPIGFTDAKQFSAGFSGTEFTSAHAMRLANVRFYTGRSMFWDRRAASVEAQATAPIQNEVEMGFDAAHGGIPALVDKMNTLPYYPELFRWVYGDTAITEDRIQRALAQYERSMVSVSSKFDTEFARVFAPGTPGNGIGAPFTGYTAQEQRGKTLFITPPNQGGAGCVACHQAPTFSLAANSRSNGLNAGETTIFKSPSLKNVGLSGPYMHDGRFQTLEQVVEHYNSGIQDGPALDNRLKGPGGQPLRLNLSAADKAALAAFMRTLNDPMVTTDPKFTNPLTK